MNRTQAERRHPETELNYSGFPMRDRQWWDTQVTTKYGPKSREDIIGFFVEAYNVCMDDYTSHPDDELKASYEMLWESVVSAHFGFIDQTVTTYDVNRKVWFFQDTRYPEVWGKDTDFYKAVGQVEEGILQTNDCRFIIR